MFNIKMIAARTPVALLFFLQIYLPEKNQRPFSLTFKFFSVLVLF